MIQSEEMLPPIQFQLLYSGTLQFESSFLREIPCFWSTYLPYSFVATVDIFCKFLREGRSEPHPAQDLGNLPQQAHPPGPGK
jgi:hypothetical protein